MPQKHSLIPIMPLDDYFFILMFLQTKEGYCEDNLNIHYQQNPNQVQPKRYPDHIQNLKISFGK